MQIEFDRGLIRLSAVKKAAYQLSSSLACEITLTAEKITCEVSSLDRGAASIQEADTAHVFRTTVLDYDLREQIGEKTETMRNAILAAAFAPLTSKLQN